MELKGDLQNFALPDVIQLLSMSRSTGKLTLGGKLGGSAIFFREGEIIHALIGNLAGEEAFYHLLSSNDGSFEFFAGVSSPQQTIKQTCMNLILEAAKRTDEQKAGLSSLPERPTPLPPQSELPQRDYNQVKARLRQIVTAAFGSKAKKIEQKIDETTGTEPELLALCDKIEKYIQVFLDGSSAKKVADRMRDAVLGIDSNA